MKISITVLIVQIPMESWVRTCNISVASRWTFLGELILQVILKSNLKYPTQTLCQGYKSYTWRMKND